MNAVRSWVLAVDAPPAPPLTAAALLARAGVVDRLLEVLLPHVLRGDSGAVRGPEGAYWRVAPVWEGSRLTVVAMELTEARAAEAAVEVARVACRSQGVGPVLSAIGPEVRLAGPGWALDGGGPLQLRKLERAAVEDALDGATVRSEEGWAAVPLAADGAPFAVLLGPAHDTGELRWLEACALTAAAPLARALGFGSSTLEGLSHELRTPLHAILGYVGLLEEELSGRRGAMADLQRIREAANTQLAFVDHLLARVRLDEGPSQLQMSQFQLAQVLDGLRDELQPTLAARHTELVVEGLDADLETDRDQLLLALSALVRGRCVAGARLWLGASLHGVMVHLELRGGRQGSRSALALVHGLATRLGGRLVLDDTSCELVVPRYGPSPS